jgi:Recombinase zinc beta ribbon domain
VTIREAHEGYITWDQYEAHLAQLAANSQAYIPPRLRPPREGPALLQGLALCGRCGARMTIRYHQRGSQRIVPDYVCQGEGVARSTPPCQRLLGREVDAAIGALLVESLTPEAVADILRVHDEVLARADEAARLRRHAVERAQYEADLAQRRYVRVDPDNRLVADILEQEWNHKLQTLAAAHEAAERQRQADETELTAMERAALLDLPCDFAHLWHDPRTTDLERKRLVRLVIEDVTLLRAAHIVVQVRFKGGATRTLAVPLPPPFAHARLTPVATLAAIDHLLDQAADAEVASTLNAQGYRTFVGLPFQAMHVSQLRRTHGIKDRYTRLREAGWLTAEELGAGLNIKPQTVWRWYRRGRVRGERYNERGTCLFWPPACTFARQDAEA